MIRAKRLKSGVLRITDTDHPGTKVDISKKSEELRMLPTLLQIAGLDAEAIETFIKEIK